MVGVDDIVITGLGCITAIGSGREAFWSGLSSGQCGTRELFRFSSGSRALYGATVENFDGKEYVTPRKALKVMGREVQLAYAAAQLAWADSGLTAESIDPDRTGVVFGSEMLPGDISEMTPAVRDCSTGSKFDPSQWGTKFSSNIYPLWMLRYLPNMPPCHIAIAIDARGPNNTIAQDEVSGLLALGEAVRIMQRGDADLLLVGATGERVTPTRLMYRLPDLYKETGDHNRTSNSFHSRAFDSQSEGIVPGEGSVVLVLERRRHAVARAAKILGTVLGTASRFGRPESPRGGSTRALFKSAEAALQTADVTASELACISAQGYSHPKLDWTEAQAVGQLTTDIPVTAYSNYFGTCGAASGLMQLAAGILATSAGKVLPIHGFNSLRTDCPIRVCRETQPTQGSLLLQLSFTPHGHAAAAIVDCL